MKKILSRLILSYFRFLARLQLRKNSKSIIIGITGSAGKTSTRLALALILQTKGKVKHSAHANSESGIPLNILGLKPNNYSPLDWLRLILLAPLMLFFNWEHFNYYIVEMGIDSPLPPKNMDYLLSILQPHIAIILNAGLVHGEAFDYLIKDRNPARRMSKVIAAIAKEKIKLAKSLDPSGVAIINLDQSEFRALTSPLKARLLTIGKSSKANLRIIKLSQSKKGFFLSFSYQSQIYSFHSYSLFPSPYAYTFAAALAAGLALGVKPEEALLALKKYVSPKGRLRLLSGKNSTKLLDSSYNSSPDSALESLLLLSKLAGRHHKLAIIGDMRELGLQTKLSHKILADWLLKYTDEVILFGDTVKLHTLPVLQAKHFPVHHFAKMSDLINYTQSHLVPGSFVLIKGSQNTIFLERATAALLAHPKDINQLCRRGQYWDQLRKLAP